MITYEKELLKVLTTLTQILYGNEVRTYRSFLRFVFTVLKIAIILTYVNIVLHKSTLYLNTSEDTSKE